MVNDINNIFRFNDFGDSRGGTEIIISQLLKHVNNDLLSKVDIIVSYPMYDFKKTTKPVILFLHDLASDPYFTIFNDENYCKNFDYFVFVSYTQKEDFRKKYKNIPNDKCYVIKNAIENNLTMSTKWGSVDKVKIAYTSSPHKGLSLCYEVFKEIYNDFGKDVVELNVFSNFATYGQRHLSRNNNFEDIYKKLEEHEGINYYGSVPHNVLLNHLNDQHIWYLPSTFPETSCISLIEAASAGCILVHNDLGALPETSSNFGLIHKYDEDINMHAEFSYETLKYCISAILSKDGQESLEGYTAWQKVYFDNFYSWEKRSKEWTIFLKSILSEN